MGPPVTFVPEEPGGLLHQKVFRDDHPAGAKGNVRTFRIKDTSLLTHMTIGDAVTFQYTEAWAVALAKM
jgi:hypothetical protein